MRGIIITIIIYLCTRGLSDAADEDNNQTNFSFLMENANENLTVLESWQNFEKSVKFLANTAIKNALPMVMEQTKNLNLSKECMRNTMLLISGLKGTKLWALRFLDSSAKIVDGILVGSLTNFGAYDECLETEVTSAKYSEKGKLLFRGQYCHLDLTPSIPPKKPFYRLEEVVDELKIFSQRDTAIAAASKYAHYFNFMRLRFGICIPSGCSPEDINTITKPLGKFLSLKMNVSRCEVKEQNEFTPLVVGVITVYSFAGFMMLVGTFIDLYGYYKELVFKNKFIRVFVAFSFFTNFQKLINTESSNDTLSCLNGIRVLCMFWIILGHTYLIINYQMFVHLEKIRDYAKNFAFQAIVNASVAVDTFFCIGGLLVAYLTLKQGKKLNVYLYILQRLWRLIPPYALVIMFIYLVNLTSSGPMWHEMSDPFVNACYKNWWTNLLFINNFYDAVHMCLPHSWYLATDFQLYIFVLIILLPMIRWPKLGIYLSIATIFGSMLYCGIETYIKDYPPTMLFTHPDPYQRMEYFAYFYFLPFVHGGPYCIGLLTGYLLLKKPDLKIPPIIQVLGWIVAFTCCSSVLYGVVGWNSGQEITLFPTLMYTSLNRVAWTLGISWMIVCCTTGHGGVINYILSWKIFIPLSRLTYMAYLIHPIVQLLAIANFRTRLQTHHYIFVYLFFGHLFITYAAAFAGSMLIEAPFVNLQKIVFPPRVTTEKNDFLEKKSNSIFNGSLKTDKNGDIAVTVPKTEGEMNENDNTVIYRL